MGAAKENERQENPSKGREKTVILENSLRTEGRLAAWYLQALYIL